MTFKELMNKLGRIYVRNVKGYFRTLGEIVTGKYKGSNQAAAAVFIISIVLFPLNLTVFAFFKALSDLYARRNELPKDRREVVIEKIEAINDLPQMNFLVQIISDYKAKSYTSRKLGTDLKDVSDLNEQKIHMRSSKKRVELQEEQFENWESCSTSNLEARVSAVVLNQNNEEILSAFTAKRLEKWTILKIMDQKKLVVGFLRDKNTPGKEMERVIDGFFKPQDSSSGKQSEEKGAEFTANTHEQVLVRTK